MLSTERTEHATVVVSTRVSTAERALIEAASAIRRESVSQLLRGPIVQHCRDVLSGAAKEGM